MFRLRRHKRVLRIGDSIRVAVGPAISAPMVLSSVNYYENGTWTATLETPRKEWEL